MNSEVVGELRKNGVKGKWTSNGPVFRISRAQNGLWFRCERSGFHRDEIRNYLPLSNMPKLSQVLSDLERVDDSLRLLGGRVFISNRGVFRK